MCNFLFSCCQAGGNSACIFNWKTGAECSSEAFVTAEQNTRCHIPEDSNTMYQTDNFHVCVKCTHSGEH